MQPLYTTALPQTCEGLDARQLLYTTFAGKIVLLVWVCVCVSLGWLLLATGRTKIQNN